jgi:hypothetical protein
MRKSAEPKVHEMNRIVVSGQAFECTAKPYPWAQGVGVQVDVTTSGKRVGSVHIVCDANRAEFDGLASLAPPELCDLALSRFVAGDLPVTLEHILQWQAKIASMGYDYVSPLGSSFSHTKLPLDGGPGATLPRIECSIVFLTPREGGRSAPFSQGALSGDGYRPHLVLGDPAQRHAIVVDGRSTEEYIGVAFHDGPAHPKAGIEMTAILTLIFYPHPMYDTLEPGVTFTVREGAQVVGFGHVRRLMDRAAARK